MPKILDTDLEANSCSSCGAVRPDFEFKSDQGCANCANLKLMAQKVKEAKEQQANSKADGEKLTETLKNLPELDKFISLLYDNERGVSWIGINLKEPKYDPLALVLNMDQLKGGLL